MSSLGFLRFDVVVVAAAATTAPPRRVGSQAAFGSWGSDVRDVWPQILPPLKKPQRKD